MLWKLFKYASLGSVALTAVGYFGVGKDTKREISSTVTEIYDQSRSSISNWSSFQLRAAPELMEGAEEAGENGPAKPRMTGIHVRQLSEVFRFEIDPDWVTQRWSRASTVPNGRLSGLRVALVTGTRTDDLAGSLTYFFGADNRLQRITFDGQTGDATRLVELLKRSYGFHQEAAAGAEFYVVRWNRQLKSALWITPSPIVRVDEPHSRRQVRLEVNRPDVTYEMSPEFLALLHNELSRQR